MTRVESSARRSSKFASRSSEVLRRSRLASCRVACLSSRSLRCVKSSVLSTTVCRYFWYNSFASIAIRVNIIAHLVYIYCFCLLFLLLVYYYSFLFVLNCIPNASLDCSFCILSCSICAIFAFISFSFYLLIMNKK